MTEAPVPSPALQAPVGRIHEVVTPEGVPLQLEVALAGDRLGALIIDLLLMAVVVFGVPLGLVFGAGAGVAGDAMGALIILVWFVVWTFYFPAFELAWQGQTPGKRVVKIRAVDARGGPLTAEAVIGRNLSRQFEIMLPLMAVFSLGASAWFDLVALGWMVALGFLPLFNKDRLRVGDMIAGTIVIRVPGHRLLEDLAARAPAAHGFTEAQLDVYGVYELQVLEGVLRGAASPGHQEAVWTVAEKIRQKIGWEGPVPSDEAFLQAFYAALRARLEKRLLFGKRRKSKHDRA
jgi:uncharacterized RDD family membrane protein YckC